MSFLLSAFLIIYGGMHVYAFYKAQSALRFTAGIKIILALFMILMILTPILTHLFNNKKTESIARYLAYFGYTWMGFLLLSTSLFLAVDIYNLVLRSIMFLFRIDFSKLILSGEKSFFYLILTVVIMAGYGIFNAQRIRTERIRITTSKLPKHVSSLTIAQISDIHLGLIVRHSLLKKIIAALDAAKPDLLVSTGDLVDAEINHIQGLVELFQKVNPKYGKFAVTGNHDFYAGISEAVVFTESAGFKLLRGEGITIDGIFNLAGVDDSAGIQMGKVKNQSEKAILGNLPQDLFTILLKHRPDISEGTPGFFDLQLSGHTHGGQIFPFTLVVYMMYPMINGLYKISKHSLLYTSTGTGTWGPPMRFPIPPKVTIIEIAPAPKPTHTQ